MLDMLESSGRLQPFTEFGVDLETRGALKRVVDQISFNQEVCQRHVPLPCPLQYMQCLSAV